MNPRPLGTESATLRLLGSTPLVLALSQRLLAVLPQLGSVPAVLQVLAALVAADGLPGEDELPACALMHLAALVQLVVAGEPAQRLHAIGLFTPGLLPQLLVAAEMSFSAKPAPSLQLNQPPAAMALGPPPPAILVRLTGPALASLLAQALQAPLQLAAGQQGAQLHPQPVDFGVQRRPVTSSTSLFASLLPPAPLARRHFREVSLYNNGSAPVVLSSLRLEPAMRAFSLHDDLGVASPSEDGETAPLVMLPPGARYVITVQLSSGEESGILASWLLATLSPHASPEALFVVGARVTAAVLSEVERAGLESARKFNPDARPFVPAELREAFDSLPTVFHAPPGVWFPARNHIAISVISTVTRASAETSREVAVLLRLLRLEEVAQARALRAFDQYHVQLRALDSGCFEAIVPGLIENRPAVSLGDLVHLRRPGGHEECAVDVVAVVPRTGAVHLAIPPDWRAIFVGGLVHMRFALDRSLLAKCSSALHAAGSTTLAERAALLPCEPAPSWLPPWAPTVAHRIDLDRESLNDEQADCVLALLNGHAEGAAHALHGPPGTGKTATVVAAALALLRRSHDALILLCAPSPFAADIIASRLLGGVREAGGSMFRVNDPRRPIASVKADVVSSCVEWCGRDLANVRLPDRCCIVASCASAALLSSWPCLASRLPFTAVFVDEAGQATCPESLIPLTPPFAGRLTSILLAGDPRQLGPLLKSKTAAAAGLGKSLLERLMDGGRDVETDGRRRITRLRCNYRSHPSVLALPSQLFYADRLKSCAPEATTQVPSEWDEAACSSRVHFHGVLGEQESRAGSLSWCNPLEATAVVELVEDFLRRGAAAEHFGLIATFRLQVSLLRDMLRARGLGAVRVGTVDDYQGQEERIIIISTVVSRPSSAVPDDSLNLLANPRRFCVAVSRAQALNIVVGHPVPLAAWPHWAALLRFAHARGAYTGAGAEGEGGDPASTVVARLAKLSLLGSGCGDEGLGAALDDESGWKMALETREESGLC